MNRNSLLQLRHFGASVNFNQGTVSIVRPVGRVIGFATPPLWEDLEEFTAESAPFARTDPKRVEFVVKDPAGRFALRAVRALAVMDDAIVTARRDKDLSSVGVGSKIDAALADAVTTIGGLWIALRDHSAKVDADELAFYALPTIEKGDTETPLADREIRDWWRNLRSDQLAEERKKLIEGDNGRVRDALLRSPTPLGGVPNERGELPDDQLALNDWRGARAKADPKGAVKLVLSRQCAEWAVGVLRGMCIAVAATANGWLPQRFYSVLKNTDRGWEAFGVTAQQAAAYKMRDDALGAA